MSYLREPELGRLAHAFRIRLAGAWLTLMALAVALYLVLRVLEQKLGERRRLSVITAALGQGLYLTNARGLIVSINPYACDLLGYRADEVLGRSAHELFHSHQANEFKSEEDCEIVGSVRARHEYRSETLFERRNGGLLEVSVVSRPLLQGSHFAGAVTVFEDISERKQAERALSENRERLAGILWGTGVGTWEWNVRTGETRFNGRWAEMIGYRLEELEPISIATWERFAHPEDLIQSERALRSHFSGESEHYEIEMRMRHRSGDWIWVLDRGRVISWGADGEPEWMAGTHLDITKRKLAEGRSFELLERLRKLTAELPGFVYQYVISPNGTAAFAYASDGIRGVFGVTPEQVRSDAAPIFNALHADDLESVSGKIAVSARELSVWHATFRVHHPDKGLIWAEGHATPEWTEEGGVVLHGYIHDVTERRQAEILLAASESKYRTLVDNAPVIIFRSELESPWRMLHVSRGAERLCGYRSARFMDGSASWYVLIWPEDVELVEATIAKAVAQRERYSIEYRIRHADGSVRWVSEIGSVQPRSDEHGGWCLEGVISDISDRKAAEREASEARMFLQAALENSPSGIIVADAPDGRIRFVNQAAVDLQLVDAEQGLEGLGEDLVVFSERWQVLQADGRPLPLADWPLTRAIDRGEKVSGEEAILVDTLGEERWISISAAPIKNLEGGIDAGIVVFSDITPQKSAQKLLEHSANHDALTGLPNRLLLADRLEQAMQRSRRSGLALALVFIDLDEFKPVNDKYGHAVGDLLLRELAQKMSGTLRAVDTLARLGGDEFVGVLSDLDGEETAHRLASRLLEVLSEPVIVDGRTLQITASIGIAMYPQADEPNPVELMRQADQAMYEAKLRGRNCWRVFKPSDQVQAAHPEREMR